MNSILQNKERLNKPFQPDGFKKRERLESIFERIFVYAFKKARVGRLFLVYEKKNEYLCFGSSESAQKVGRNEAVLWVSDMRFFQQTVLYGDIGLGEAFFLNYWNSPDVQNVLNWAIHNKDYLPTFANGSFTGYLIDGLGFMNRLRHLLRPNTQKISKKNIAEHYDLSNDFFKLILDKNMTYSCALFKKNNESLEKAQLNKFERLCQILNLSPTDHLLEIGGGWGGFAIYAAQKYGCKIDTITISQEQYNYTQALVKAQRLKDRINVRLEDYRQTKGKYDKIVSIEMVEALGFQYFDIFFRKCAELLKSQGLMAIQCITFPDPHYKTYLKNTDFIQKHIFPGSELLSIKEILNSLDRTSDMMIWDVKSLGQDYAKTLSKWRENLLKNAPQIQQMPFGETFIRKWLFYLDYCIAGFENFYLNAVQILFSKPLNKMLKF